MHIDTLSTPCVLVDIDRVKANIGRAQTYANTHGFALRPHIKTHKIPAFARLQVEAGARGITCQKLGEAEVMADAGLDDILISYNLVGIDKLTRLAALARRVRLTVAADSPYTVAGYNDIARAADVSFDVLIECDTGGGRCGVQTPEDALTLAATLGGGARFAGLMTYPAAGKTAEMAAWIDRALAVFSAASVPVGTVSAGGTPDLWRAHTTPGLTEYRPGTYVYMDRSQVAAGAATMADCALTVLATVVSKPRPDRAIIDAGTKSLTSDLLGMEGFGHVPACPQAIVSGLSEEHGILRAEHGLPEIGARLRIVPNHACVVSNMFDHVYLVSGDRVLDCIPVAARGRVS
ncbi:D-TA family PLP-dependent enzyme [Gluconacetobacter tumulicola]|uniref:D-TA family PLP-dependent enzyme n=1 Tax=Gluconacetobacter tumulicola TaxID=1017177 RepID=A0A7W4JCT8_9PROT|nr:D-TA family PLP-dependent enzyme [Gluconacetobacter tumulicola]MBB2178744.1 D-TA family PLP-dependent enzyme [Gluconacetobacter tumulicola]